MIIVSVYYLLIRLYKFYKQQRQLKQRYYTHMHINTSHNNAQQLFITFQTGFHLPLTSRHKDHTHDSSWYNRQALTTRNTNQKQDMKINFSTQSKNRQNFSFMKEKESQTHSGRSGKIVSHNKLKPCSKPAKVIQLKGQRRSQNANNSFQRNLQYGEVFMNKFTPKNVSKRVDAYRNVRNKLSLTIADSANKPIYNNPLAVKNSQNSQQSSNNESVKIVNQRMKDLKLSESVDPIVEPYRDRSTDSYHYGQGYGYGMQALSHKQSPYFDKEDIRAGFPIVENLQAEPKYFHQNIESINSLYRNSPNPPRATQKITVNSDVVSANKKHIQIKMDNIKQDAQEFEQESKQLQKTRKYSEQPINTNEKTNFSPKYYPHRYQSQNTEQINQKKRIFLFPDMPVETYDSKQLKEEGSKKYYQGSFHEHKQQQKDDHKKKQTQAQKCAKITQLYQPFSMQMSSNRKNNIASQDPSYQLPKNEIGKKSSSKKFQHPQSFDDEDKWDRILKMRQLAYQRSEQQNHEMEHGSLTKDKKAGTAFSTAIKHPFSITPAVSIHQSLQQSQRSYVINNINSPTSSKAGPMRLQHRISSPINQLNKAMINPVSNSGSHVYSYSYEPSCEYSYLENSNLNQKQGIKSGRQYEKYDNQARSSDRQNAVSNVQSLYNKFKTIAAQYNLQNNAEISAHQSVYKGQQLTMNQKASRINNKNRPSGPEEMTYSYSFQENPEGQYRYEREIFSKYLHARHIEWMPIFSRMIQHVNNQIQSRIVPSNFQQYQNNRQNNQDRSALRYREDSSEKDENQQILITFVKIGDSGQSIYQNRIISHYIGIWLLTMGFDDPEIKQRVVSNVQLMFSDVEDLPKNRQNQQMRENDGDGDEQIQEFANIRQIAQLMYNNLLYGYLPADLQLRALLQVCRRGFQYLTFLIIKILKLLIKIGKNNQNKHNLMASLENSLKRGENQQQIISDQQLYKKLQSLIDEDPENQS